MTIELSKMEEILREKIGEEGLQFLFPQIDIFLNCYSKQNLRNDL